jgi:hypothetical protein
MKEKPTQEVHHGQIVWVNPTTEWLRKAESLCYNCDKFHPGEETNCPISQKLFEIAKTESVAMIVTRCPVFEPKHQ